MMELLENQENIVVEESEYLSLMHEEALKYIESGWSVLPLLPDTKEPRTPNGFYNASTDTTVINRWWLENPEYNVAICTGTESRLLVLDVDVKNGVDGYGSLKELTAVHGDLPDTRMHKTPSGGCHYLFRCNIEVPNSYGKIGIGLDIKAEKGYVVAPPSVIEGKYYDVVNPETPLSEAPEWLIKIASEKRPVEKKPAVRQVANQGQRNDHIFKSAINAKRNGLTYNDALTAAIETNSNQCKPPLEHDEVEKTVSSAYRYEVSQPPTEIDEMNEIYAAIMVAGNCYVLEETICPTYKRPDFELLSVKGFKEYFCNRYIELNGKRQRLGEAWFSHPNRKQYKGLVFNPKETPEGYYNIWRGFAVEPKTGDCSLYLKHIEENIANGDKAVYNYLIAWMAHTVQHPDNLVGVAPVLRGSMGVGKGVYADEFGKLFGRHYMLLNDSNQLTGKFNGHMKDKVLLFADEAFWAGDKSAEGKLKSMITEPTLVVEMKGKDAYTIKNNLHMIFATNNEWAAPAGPKERRFFVIDVGEKHSQDSEYFKTICNQMDNGGREALLHYLMNYNLSGVNLRQFPQTSALRDAKMLSASPVQKFWHHVLESGYIDELCLSEWSKGNETVQCSALFKGYLEFVSNMGIKHKGTETELGMQLRKMLPGCELKKQRLTIKGSYSGARKNHYTFPILDECRKAFEGFMNTKFEWPTE